jgi:hypothetical protein
MVALHSPIQVIEFFHLAFLEVLQVRLDQTRYVLKGGANLRFFFRSPRYSEDLDLDAVRIDQWRLEEKVDQVLASRPIELILRAQSLKISAVTKPKQTATTQRWKLSLSVAGRGEPVRTKIEFSRRSPDDRCKVDQIPPDVVAPYALRPPTVNRYLPIAMVEQKIVALLERSETQPRDVFDLDLLFQQWRDKEELHPSMTSRLDAAAARVLELTFAGYESLVVRFLDPEIVELYNRQGHWEQMQLRVAERLRNLK